jgi:Domain of unknown function (DUF1707)
MSIKGAVCDAARLLLRSACAPAGGRVPAARERHGCVSVVCPRWNCPTRAWGSRDRVSLGLGQRRCEQWAELLRRSARGEVQGAWPSLEEVLLRSRDGPRIGARVRGGLRGAAARKFAGAWGTPPGAWRGAVFDGPATIALERMSPAGLRSDAALPPSTERVVKNEVDVDGMGDPEDLVSDAEREQAVRSLRDGLLDGRLTLEGFSERVEIAYSARIGKELARARAGLPAAAVWRREAGGANRSASRAPSSATWRSAAG